MTLAYEAKIILDSVAWHGKGITSFQCTLPRAILAELRTHRLITDHDEPVMWSGTDETGRSISMNSASSRAIPVEKMIAAIMDDPYIPVFTGSQSGMQGIDRSEDPEWQAQCRTEYLIARDRAVERAKKLLEMGVHKQDANRLIENFGWHTVVLTATDWSNYWALRVHPMAHPAIRKLAEMMKEAKDASVPQVLQPGEWHLPYITVEDVAAAKAYAVNGGYRSLLCMMSAARCGRVSFMRHTDVKSIEDDIKLYNRFVGETPKHASPTEHQATPADTADTRSGNFVGWIQYRKTIEGECVEG